MATYRTVKTSFWTDRKIVENFSPEDKYFYLYLLTNPKTTQLGIYEFVPKLAAFDLGYSKDAVMVLLDRFENKYGLIRYSPTTGEVAIKNFLTHSIIKGGKPVMDCLKKEEELVKDKDLVIYIVNNLKDISNLNDTVKKFIEYIYTKDFYLDDKDNDNDNDNERNVDDTSDDTSNVDDLADELFETLWSMYPKKRGKGSVTSKQKRRLLEIGFDGMARCIDRYTAEIKGKSEQYIKNGSTFFNSGYVDYLDENYSPMLTKAEKDAQLFRNVAHEYIRDGEMLGI